MSLASATLGVGSLAGTFLLAAPTVTVTAPTGTVTVPTQTVTWSYSSLAGRTQATYRVRYQSPDGSVTLYDSGIVTSAATSVAVPFTLSTGSSYLAVVTCSDGFDQATSSAVFLFDGTDPNLNVNADVGSVYEVGLNGVGYMLADRPAGEQRYERRVIPLDPPRFATSETPFSQAIERYTLASSADWSSGAGQTAADRETSTSAAFRRSHGIDPFTTPGSFRLVPNGAVKHSTAYSTVRAVTAGAGLYVLTASGQVAYYATPATVSPTVFTITGAGAPASFASDGSQWYYSDGSNIYRNTTPASPGSAWSTQDAAIVEWCTDRIFIARPGTASGTPNELVEMGDGGTPVGGARIWTLRPETTISTVTSGDGWVWFAGNRVDRAAVFAIQLGSDASYVTAWEAPAGVTVTALGHYQGNVMVRTVDGAGRATIYRCATEGGKLTPTRVLDIPTVNGLSQAVGEFSGDDRYVYFSWRAMGEQTIGTGRTGSGIGAIDLSTGGWATWVRYNQAGSEGTGNVGSIVQWAGRTCFTVDQIGAVVTDVDNGLGDDGTVASGALETSVFDLGTSLRKVWSEVVLAYDTLPVGATVTVAWSRDGGLSFTDLPAAGTAGTKVSKWTLGVEAEMISFRIRVTATTFTPVVRSLTVRANPVGLADQVLVLPVDCSDRVKGLNGREIPGSGPGSGSARARQLESLVQTRVRVQDVDWAVTGSAQWYDCIAAETRSVGVYANNVNRQAQSMVTVLTLRRSFK
jgi:hypothetical protein